MEREPLVTVGVVTAGVSAIIGLLTAFGLPLNDEKTAAIMAVVAVAAPLVVAALARPKVTPVAPAHRSEVGATAGEVALIVIAVALVLLLLTGFGVFR